jgi:hypothetical protein
MEDFRKQHLNASLDGNAQEDIKKADPNDLVPLWRASPSSCTSGWQAICALSFEANTQTRYYRIEN